MSELQRPKGIKVVTNTDTFGRFSAAPFERGYGVTVGNSLRRVLIDSIGGAAVTAVRFAGVQHEMSTISGVKEDTMDIILNLKTVPLRLHGNLPRMIRVRSKQPRVLTSADLETDPNVEILQDDVYLATMTEPGDLDIEMRVKNARGRVPAESNRDEDLDLGFIPLDSTHSPVRKVNYTVEPARVGQDTDLDKLVIDVHTNGSVKPVEALFSSARVLREMLGIFSGGDSDDLEAVVVNEEQIAFETHRYKSIEEIGDKLSVRAYNGLRNADISTLGDLVVRTADELIKERNLGRKSIEEIEKVLKNLNLHLGMGSG